MVHIKDPESDPGTPEEEAMRYRALPLLNQHHRWENFKNLFGTKYHFYNHPGNEDLFGKIAHLNSLAFRPALLYGLFDAMMVTQQKTIYLRTVRTLHFIWPAQACATAFATGAYVAANIRGKDDFLNHIVGALAAGSVIGKWAQCGLWGWNAFFIFTIAAGVQHVAHKEGWKIFHEFDTRSYEDIKDAETVRWHKVSRQSFHLYKDIEKGYITKH